MATIFVKVKFLLVILVDDDWIR